MSEQDSTPTEAADDMPSDEEILATVGEPEQQDDRDEGEEAPEEFDEVDWDEGKKVKVSKGFKDALLREKDYRHKTHEVGEEKRTLAAERAALAEERRLHAEFDDERAELKALDKKLAEYDKVTPEQWLQWREQDEKAVSDAQFAREMLKQQKDKLIESMKGKHATLTAREKERLATWEAEQNKAIKEKVPDWTSEKAKTVAEHVGPKFGLDPKVIAGAKDAGVIALLNYVYKQDKAIEAAKAKVAAARRDQQPEPEPVAKVGGNRASAPRGPNPQTLRANPAAFDREISKMIYGGGH
jgi:hypothetical protein